MNIRYEGIISYEWKGSPDRIRMPLEQRAKIFAPFAALKGYSELIRKTEEEVRQRYEMNRFDVITKMKDNDNGYD